MDFRANDDRLSRAYTAGWMQGWVDSGCSAPPRAENAPRLPEEFCNGPEHRFFNAAKEAESEDCPGEIKEPRSWMSKPNARSGIITRSVTIIHQHGDVVPVVKFVSLPNMARPLLAAGKAAGDGKAAWDLTVMFYVDNESDYRVFDKRYALLSVGSAASLAGSKIEDTDIRFWYGGSPYFMFRVY